MFFNHKACQLVIIGNGTSVSIESFFSNYRTLHWNILDWHSTNMASRVFKTRHVPLWVYPGTEKHPEIAGGSEPRPILDQSSKVNIGSRDGFVGRHLRGHCDWDFCFLIFSNKYSIWCFMMGWPLAVLLHKSL